MKNISGIYKIENKINGKIYVGSAVNIRMRWNGHKSELSRNIHGNKKLQRSWNKYGREAFEFLILQEVENKSDLLTIEQQWIDSSQCIKNGYNILPVAGSRLGVKQTEEHKKKISIANSGKTRTKEHQEKLNASNRGNKRSDETKQKLSEAHKRRLPRTEESKNKTSESLKGRVFSEETRGKISLAAKNITPEHRAKLSAARIGIVFSAETRLKMSLAAKNRKKGSTNAAR